MNPSNHPHEEILAVLEEYKLDWHIFADLRSDSYEQKLAQHSPELLEQFYSVLFSPGFTLPEKALLCPPWPVPTTPGKRRPKGQPSVRLLSDVAKRWNAQHVFDVASQVAKIVDKFRALLSTLPNAQMDNVMDSLCAMLSQELIAAKLEGLSLSQQTKAMVLLLRKKKLDLDALSREQSLKDDATKALELCLAEAKAFPDVQELFKTAFTALRKARSQ